MDAIPRSKVTVPTPPRGAFSRIHLLERLRRAHADLPRLTLIAAPPGYGKTTFAAQWVASLTDDRAAWISLDTGDNDLLRFLRHLQRAIEPLLPSDAELVPVGLQLPPPQELAQAVALLLEEIGKTIVVVLDDLHLIRDPAVLSFVSELVAMASPFVHLVLITREDPPFRLARLRASGRLTEIRSSDLAFREDELALLAADTVVDAGVGGVLHQIHQESEGWPVAVAFGARVLETGEADEVERAIENRRHLVQYFTEEVLGMLSSEQVSLLTSVSILDRLEPALCALLSGNARAGEALEELCDRQLFVVLVPSDPPTYRIHPLFAQFLRARLSAGDLRSLHRQAALNSASPVQALEHARVCGQPEVSVAVLKRVVPVLIRDGASGTVRYWLNQFPDEVAGDAELSLLGVQLDLLSTGQVDLNPHSQTEHAFFSAWLSVRNGVSSSVAPPRDSDFPQLSLETALTPLLNALLASAMCLAGGAMEEAVEYGRVAVAGGTRIGSPVLEAMSVVWLVHLLVVANRAVQARSVVATARRDAPERARTPGGRAAYLSLLELADIELAGSDSSSDEGPRVGRILLSAGAEYVLPISPAGWLVAADPTGTPSTLPSSRSGAAVLTPREQEVLLYLDQGLRNADIAERLFVSVGTVKWHVIHILQKLEAHTRTEAVRKGRLLGYTDPGSSKS